MKMLSTSLGRETGLPFEFFMSFMVGSVRSCRFYLRKDCSASIAPLLDRLAGILVVEDLIDKAVEDFAFECASQPSTYECRQTVS